MRQQENDCPNFLPTLTRAMSSSRTGCKDVLGSFLSYLAPGHALLKYPQHVQSVHEGLSQLNTSLYLNSQFESLVVLCTNLHLHLGLT